MVERIVERALWTAGVVAVATYAGVRGLGQWSGEQAVIAFRAERAAGTVADGLKLRDPAEVDRSLWSESRRRQFESALAGHVGRAIAVLRIPKIRLEVPVFEGTDESVLNRGVGRIRGTAAPGREGNLGIAGHRDGFFRGLASVGLGDALELELPGGTERYTVTAVLIVPPEEVGVLDPTAEPSMTLVTCFPFYFVGSAPERYVVRAVRNGKE